MIKRRLSIFLAFALIASILFASVFIALEADHDCVGDDCAICYQISVCESVLRTISQILLVLFVAAFVSTSVVSFSTACRRLVGVFSLVSLKVKLSN